VLAVANVWEERKGLSFIIELANILPQDKFKIMVVGLNEKQAKIAKNITAIPKTANVNELCKLYSSADVFINPTLEDNFPTANIEAIASGTPVVTFNTGGSGESITKDTGIVTKNKTAQALAQAVIDAVKLKSNKQSFSLHALNYNKQTKYGEYIALFKE
jgi:glycosyltransferase involved in cell wall biosynthesis